MYLCWPMLMTELSNDCWSLVLRRFGIMIYCHPSRARGLKTDTWFSETPFFEIWGVYIYDQKCWHCVWHMMATSMLDFYSYQKPLLLSNLSLFSYKNLLCFHTHYSQTKMLKCDQSSCLVDLRLEYRCTSCEIALLDSAALKRARFHLKTT